MAAACTQHVGGPRTPQGECRACKLARDERHREKRRAVRQGLPSAAVNSLKPDPVARIAEKYGAPKPRAPRLGTIVAFSDIHAPGHHDPIAWGTILDAIRQVKPDSILMLGDICDFSSFNSHPPHKVPELEDAISSTEEEASGWIREINKVRALHAGPIKYLEGNHENRVEREIARRFAQLNGVVTVPKLLDLDRLDIEWLPDTVEHTRVATNLAAVHGHLLFRGKFGAPLHHTRKALEKAGTSVIYGHTHRTQLSTQETYAGGVLTAYGLGCGAKLHPIYTGGVQGAAGHDHGFALIDVSSATGRAYVTPVRIVDGEASVMGARFVGRG